jgi:hypothetical protein
LLSAQNRAILVLVINKGHYMLENIEIRKVANGFILVVTTEDDTEEFVYDTQRKLLSKIKTLLGDKKED